ncbi:MAG: aldehyde dehydrogenase family protein [Pseudomonadota bacterium]
MNISQIFQSMDYGPAPEAADEVKAWLAARKAPFGFYIGGKWLRSKGGSFITHNPATGEALAKISQGSAADVDKAVKAARRAQPAWAALGGHRRARFLYALARAVQKNSRRLAVLETLDNGKPIRETRDIDIPLVARHFYHHAGWAQLLAREFPGCRPLGVVGQIIPWNFPLLMLAWKVAPALAAGNTVVLKPAEYTSLTALAFAELCDEVGLPPGVLNIVTGDGRTGAAVVAHPDVDKLAFTGSTEVGRSIRAASAGSGKKLTLELGGKSPFLVFEDADIDSAIEGLIDGIWFNQGQVCCAGSRLLVQEGVAAALERKIKRRLGKIRLGDPLDKAIDMGAIVDPVQKQRIEELVAAGVAQGAVKWQPDIACPDKGCYYKPTLLTHVETANIVAREEIFGPVLTLLTFRTQAEAVALANNSRYGLAASIWSENINRALDVAPKLKAGVVWINCTNQFDAAVGFGGYRESGFGREGGREGMLEYLAEPALPAPRHKKAKPARLGPTPPAIDRTAKLYIGGKQARPDGGYSRLVGDALGRPLERVAQANRKDVRNAVEAAHKSPWPAMTGHGRAQVLYFLAENLGYRHGEFAARLRVLTGTTPALARREVDGAIARLFTYAAWADKYDGAVHAPPLRGVALAMNEAVGVIGIVCPDEAPLLSFISLAAPALALGNKVVMAASERHPLIATDFYQVLETSDMPAGAFNILTGPRAALAKTLAEHDDVDALWYFAADQGFAEAERASVGNLKRVWSSEGQAIDWLADEAGEGRRFLRRAAEVKNIWIPYGD